MNLTASFIALANTNQRDAGPSASVSDYHEEMELRRIEMEADAAHCRRIGRDVSRIAEAQENLTDDELQGVIDHVKVTPSMLQITTLMALLELRSRRELGEERARLLAEVGTLKARVAELEREARSDREPGCQCHLEIGDSPCRVHGEESE